MAEPSDNDREDEILVLPWKRWPHYLICVVALANLVAGVVALNLASGFASDIASFGDGAAALFVGLFGLLFIWVAWCFRKGVLPVRFVADAQRRECGFRWGPWWNGRFDLAAAEKLVGELRPHRGHWRWAILSAGQGETEQWIYGPRQPFDSAEEAQADCEKFAGQLGEHLSLPSEIRHAGQH